MLMQIYEFRVHRFLMEVTLRGQCIHAQYCDTISLREDAGVAAIAMHTSEFRDAAAFEAFLDDTLRPTVDAAVDDGVGVLPWVRRCEPELEE